MAELYIIIPFIFLLLSVALMPLVNKHFWEKKYHWFSFIPGIIVILYYALFLNNFHRVMETFHEYFSFICLIGSLYIVTGGILIKFGNKGGPLVNSTILLIGSLLSNLIGTTGASMLLIRPFIQANKKRLRGYLVVFFIFTVSNIGGALTPIGDPPLFLGFLKGVPFFWVLENNYHIWITTISIIIATFFIIDFHYYNKEKHYLPGAEKIEENRDYLDDDLPMAIQIYGFSNIVILSVVVISVFWPSPYREIVMILASIVSMKITPEKLRAKNEFNFEPIKEVAILFAGIFATMIPALDWLSLNSKLLGVTTAGSYYWSTGILSSFLDNAPTYLNFFTIGVCSQVSENPGLTAQNIRTFIAANPKILSAISMGAVFFGACTYIGNGPNFMVKSIAEQSGIKMPDFLSYIAFYVLPFLLPVLTLVWCLYYK